jgi:hypothetical protein
MRATGEKRDQDGQVGQREEQLIRFRVGGLSSACNEAQVTALCEVTDVIHTNSREIGDFRVGENLLA